MKKENCEITVPIHNADPRIRFQHSQFSSQHNVSRPGLTTGFGSTPHIPRDLQHYYQNYEQYQPPPPQYPGYPGYRDIEQEATRFFLHDSPAPPQRKTWAQHAQQQQENAERGWQVGRLPASHA